MLRVGGFTASQSQKTKGPAHFGGLTPGRGFQSVNRVLPLTLTFQRQFQITEKVGLRFRGEFFNIFNHPNFGPPTNNLTGPLFGYSTQTLASSLGSGGPMGGFNPLYQIGGPRSIQLALKLEF